MSIVKEDRYCEVDHANKQLDRLRANPNLVSKRRATQHEAEASNRPPRAADLDDESAEDVD